MVMTRESEFQIRLVFFFKLKYSAQSIMVIAKLTPTEAHSRYLQLEELYEANFLGEKGTI